MKSTTAFDDQFSEEPYSTMARTGNTDRDQEMYSAGLEAGEANAKNNAALRAASASVAPGDAQDEDDSIALDKLADYIADTWPDKKYSLEEICQRLHAMWPGEFTPLEDLSKNLPNVREALRALLTHWKRFQASDGNQQDAYNLPVKTARFAWQFAEVEIDRVPVSAPAAGDALPSFDIEAAAQKMAACMDYPWAHMPEQGRAHMRKYAQAVIDAAIAAQQGKGGEA